MKGKKKGWQMKLKTMKNFKNINAKELLKKVVLERNWHQGRIERRLAAVTKKNVLADKLSYEKASAILALLGFEKVHDETWRQFDVEERAKRDAATPGEEHIRISVTANKALCGYDESKPMDKIIHLSKNKKG